MSSLVGNYEAFVQEHGQQIGQLETALNTGLMFLPGRYSESQVRYHTLQTVLNTLSFYNDVILFKRNHKNSPVLRSKALALSLVELWHLLFEVWADEKKPEWRWNMVIFCQLVMAVLRFLILRELKKNILPVVEPPKKPSHLPGLNLPELPKLPEAENPLLALDQKDSGTDTDQNDDDDGGADEFDLVMFRKQYQLAASADQVSCGKRTKKLLPSFSSIDKYRPHAEGVSEKYLSEIIYTLRPLLFALATKRYGQRSWKPFLLALGLHIASLHLLGRAQFLRQEEKDEQSRRRKALLGYFMKPPLFNSVTVRPILGICHLLAKLPGIGGMFASADNIAEYTVQYFSFYE